MSFENCYQGNNRAVDMFVGDIYDGKDYSNVWLMKFYVTYSL